MVMPKLGVKNIIINWPAESKEIAEAIINKYGEPDEATPSMLIWYNNGPWNRTIVYRDTVEHNFPSPHRDRVEQFINYDVPIEKSCELAAFNGCITIYRTRGEISAYCHDEQANFLALNLAHDIIQDKKTFEKARKSYVDNMNAFRQNKPAPYMGKLNFPPQKDTADLDESIKTKQKLSKARSEAGS